jgi:LPXTG-site transpeptidase (sortase) family protein
MAEKSRNTRTRPPAAAFAAATVVIFLATLSTAASVGFVPYYIDGVRPVEAAETSIAKSEESSSEAVALSDLPQLGLEELLLLAQGLTLGADAVAHTSYEMGDVLPARIIIPSIQMDLDLQNPSTRNIEALDELLKDGPARYVDSAQLGGPGNVLLFAHSSNLPVVHNQMYKAFNRVKDLEKGDVITLVGEDGLRYLYSVTSLEQVNAEDAVIDLSPARGTRLTLVTCDTLTSKSARFVLEAEYIGTAQ